MTDEKADELIAVLKEMKESFTAFGMVFEETIVSIDASIAKLGCLPDIVALMERIAAKPR